jgi:2-dehydro-3-deoxy-D-arabinonate dehydratase
MHVFRNDKIVFSEVTTLSELRSSPKELIEFLYRDTSFPHGAFLMTGTGIIPSDEFSLISGDKITIAVDHIGTLENYVQ